MAGLNLRGKIIKKQTIGFCFALMLLPLVFIVPLLATTSFSSPDVNFFVAIVQVFFSLYFLPSIVRLIQEELKPSIIAIVALALLSTCLIYWLIFEFNYAGRLRYSVYFVQLLFFVALYGAFNKFGERVFFWIFVAKTVSVVFAMCIVALFLIDLPNDLKRSALEHPPIYRNLRHMNYDLFFIGCIGVYFYSRVNLYFDKFLMILFVMIGYFTIWSAARGELMGGLAYLLILFASCRTKILNRELLTLFACFCVGGILVFMLGETHFWQNRLYEPGQSLNEVSSRRIELWAATIAVIADSNNWIFGVGPDAFYSLEIFPLRVQAHNAVIHWLLEFGVVGTLGIFLLIFPVSRKAFINLKSAGEVTLPVVVSALLFATFIYAMVDGLFYHGLSLAMIVCIMAYLAWVPEKRQRSCRP